MSNQINKSLVTKQVKSNLQMITLKLSFADVKLRRDRYDETETQTGLTFEVETVINGCFVQVSEESFNEWNKTKYQYLTVAELQHVFGQDCYNEVFRQRRASVYETSALRIVIDKDNIRTVKIEKV